MNNAHVKWSVFVLFMAPFLALGVIKAVELARQNLQAMPHPVDFGSRGAAPFEVRLPGPARMGDRDFVLNEDNAQTMTGMDDPVNGRWRDVAGNHYSERFVRRFSYGNAGPAGPRALVRVEPRANTLKGRLEARGLKPFFAYQIKLQGDFADRKAFERIGYAGRWRLPGRETNYADSDYAACADKQNAEAYILFDFFVTDAKGNGVRDFALDSSLHVLWNAARQKTAMQPREALSVRVTPSSPETYARPKNTPSIEYVWAEPERHRYSGGHGSILLPAGRYSARLVLTEESFHSVDRDGGYWATPYSAPVEFEICPAPRRENAP